MWDLLYCAGLCWASQNVFLYSLRFFIHGLRFCFAGLSCLFSEFGFLGFGRYSLYVFLLLKGLVLFTLRYCCCAGLDGDSLSPFLYFTGLFLFTAYISLHFGWLGRLAWVGWGNI